MSSSALPFWGLVLGLARWSHTYFDQAMACRGVKVEVIELFEIADALERGRSKRAFSVKSMKDDALKEVTEGEVMVPSERFKYFQDAFFHSDAGLDSLDLQLRFGDELTFHRYLCTRVHKYLSTCRPRPILRRRSYRNFCSGPLFT